MQLNLCFFLRKADIQREKEKKQTNTEENVSRKLFCLNIQNVIQMRMYRLYRMENIQIGERYVE